MLSLLLPPIKGNYELEIGEDVRYQSVWEVIHSTLPPRME